MTKLEQEIYQSLLIAEGIEKVVDGNPVTASICEGHAKAAAEVVSCYIKNTYEIDKAFCWKRIGEQEDYLNKLYNRKSELTTERYIELMQSAVERKAYFFEQLIKLRSE